MSRQGKSLHNEPEEKLFKMNNHINKD